MSRLEELLQTLCPDGVEYLELQKIFDYRNGYTPSTKNDKYWDNGSIPWFTMKDLRANGGILRESIEKITPDAIKGSLFESNSIIMSTSATIGEHALILVDALSNQRFTCLTRKEKFKGLLIPKFVYYYCFILGQWCRENINVSGFASVDMGRFSKFKFPILPLQVQEEIVRILDTFTALETELENQLEAELAARTQQYEHYRNALFKANQKSEKKTLGDIGKVCMCRRIYKEQTDSSGDVPFYKIGTFGKTPDAYISKDLFDEYKSKYSYPNKGDILFSAAGTIGRTVIFDGSPAYFQDSNIVWIENDETLVLNKYLYYFYSLGNWATSEGGTIARLYNTNISKTPISVPPLKVQEEIVFILDRFDTLVNDLKSGLPAEIALRRKQYEYYRDKLLTFEPKPPL